VVSTVEHIRFTLMAWLNGTVLKQCLDWQLQGEKLQALSVIIGKKLKKVKRWPNCSLNHPL
jgi:hypothetical protein